MADPPTSLNLEIHDERAWRPVGHVRLLEPTALGLSARAEFCYDLDYATLNTDAADCRSVSCLVPVGFEPFTFPGWPPFLLDLFPQGAALKYVVDHYRIPDRAENYWQILSTAKLNPPGNVRVIVADTAANAPLVRHRGFSRADVVSKGPDFLEYMVRCGAPVAGTTGAGGAAPKFLLRQDHRGRFHADGTLPDSDTRACWLVKFPRGAKTDDRDILRSESAYAKIAAAVGLQVHQAATWEEDCLFIPRFDRQLAADQITYLGLESFYSLAGRAAFGSRLEHETYLKALAMCSSEPLVDICEYVLRDFFNVMVGNTDNHGRNSSALKGRGWVRLAPLYDVAPMKFDPEGIVRNTRWGVGEGNVRTIVDYLSQQKMIDERFFQRRLRSFYKATANLATRLAATNVPPRFIKGTAADRDAQHRAIGRYLESVE